MTILPTLNLLNNLGNSFSHNSPFVTKYILSYYETLFQINLLVLDIKPSPNT